MIEKVNIEQKLGLIHEHWSPRIVGQVNDFHIKIVKLQGEFMWHHHEHEDELFMVVRGQLRIKVRDQEDIVLNEGEMVVIPRMVEHLPIAESECHVMLFEPATTLNTGTEENERTVIPKPI